MDLALLSTPLVNVDPQSGEVTFNVIGSREVMRARILALKDTMIAAVGENPGFPIEHIICDGTYTRKLFIPKGAFLVGKIHRKDCVNIVAAGDITVLTEFGSKRVGPGSTAISRAGTMKVGYAHADTVFLNVFRTDKTKIDEIEREIACTDFADLEPHKVLPE